MFLKLRRKEFGKTKKKKISKVRTKKQIVQEISKLKILRDIMAEWGWVYVEPPPSYYSRN